MSDLTNLADRHQERADRLAECSRQTSRMFTTDEPEMVFTYTMRTSYPLTYICELDGAEPRTTEQLIAFIERLAVKENQSVLEALTDLDFIEGDIIEVDVELR